MFFLITTRLFYLSLNFNNNENKNFKVDVLKVSHHGANTSTSEEFLSCIEAKVALIGVSKNNIYNHPSLEVIERLKRFNIYTYLTSEDKNVKVYKSLISERIIIEKE